MKNKYLFDNSKNKSKRNNNIIAYKQKLCASLFGKHKEMRINMKKLRKRYKIAIIIVFVAVPPPFGTATSILLLNLILKYPDLLTLKNIKKGKNS